MTDNNLDMTQEKETKKGKKKKLRHSSTYYLPRKFQEEFQRALRVVGVKKYGQNDPHGNYQSKLVFNCLMSLLISEGLFNNNGEPVMKNIVEEEEEINKLKAAPRYQVA